MKVCVFTDIEGVAGVVSHEEHSYATGKFYEESKRLLTGEVNAAVEGLLAEGVGEVLVVDGHGPGGIHFESLHPRALLLHGRPITRAQMIGPIAGYDAMVMIGQHARAGVCRGNQNHTMDSRSVDWMRLNGRLVGETAMVALSVGALGVPLVFLSGDEAACEEARTDVPGIFTVSVKKGLSANTEITLSAEAARAKIREGIAEALRAHRRAPVEPVRWPGPYRLEIRWKNTQAADLMEFERQAERVDDQTVAFTSGDILDVLYYRSRPIPRGEPETNGRPPLRVAVPREKAGLVVG